MSPETVDFVSRLLIAVGGAALLGGVLRRGLKRRAPRRWTVLLIAAGIVMIAAGVTVNILGEDYGMCIEGGEPPHCAGPGGPPGLSP